MRLTHLAVVFVLATATACNQNPFPSDGVISHDPPAPVQQTDPAYSLEAPTNLDFPEGQATQIQLIGHVPAPGKAVLEATGLPDGATFDPATGTLSWTPDFSVAGNPSDPQAVYKDIPIKVLLRSTQDPITAVSKDLTLHVQDVLRPLKIVVDSDSYATEGVRFSQRIEVISADFPDGPFNLQSEDLPDGATISSNGPHSFTVSYKPPYDAVTYRDDYDDAGGFYYNTQELHLVAFGPRSQSISQDLSWQVRDVRQTVSVSSPANVSGGADVNFMIVAQDLNGEKAPRIDFDPKPDFGNPTLQTVSLRDRKRRSEAPLAMVQFRWDQIPVEQMNVPHTVNFKICTVGKPGARACIKNPVQVTFSSSPHPSPEIDRSDWQVGNIKYLRSGESLEISLPVSDPELGKPVNVRIEPEEVAKQITWNDGYLTLTPATDGPMPFNVVATSGYGMVSIATFSLEVMPANWSSTLLLVDRAQDPETLATLALLPEGTQILNPALQILDDRVMALRDTVWIGTGALTSGAKLDQLWSSVKGAKRVVLSSPLASDLLAQGAAPDVQGIGRLNAQNPPAPSLNALTFIPDSSAWPAPTGSVGLAGKLTTESSNPLVLDVIATGHCEVGLRLYKDTQRYREAIGCSRDDGGTILVSGFEWADVSVTASDAKIVSQWLAPWVTP